MREAMKKYLLFFVFLTTSLANADENRFQYVERSCVRAYSQVDILLQFLYKFEGNLPDIKESKIKSLKFLIERFRNFENPTAVQKQAFGELFNDADYYQLQLQERSLNLIKELEELKNNSSPIKDKDLILSLPKSAPFGDYQNPYFKIKKFVRIQNQVRDFFDELETSKNRLEQLNQQHRLDKAMDYNNYDLGFIPSISKAAIGRVIECNLDYLEAKRISK
jgi:hypothetical protein